MIQANQKSSPLTAASANCASLGKKDHHSLAGTVHQQSQFLHQNGPQKRKASSGMNCRKRSAEPRPHPPHLLNKRYWDELKACRAKQPQAGIEAANELPKKAKLEPIVVKQQPPRAFGLANANKRSQPDLSTPKQANAERMVISRPSANSQASIQSPTIRILSGGAAAACSPPQQQWNAVGGAGSSIRLSFPPPPPPQLPAFPHNLGPAFLASTLPLGPPPNGFPMLPPHSLSSRFLPPFIPPQLFSTAPQSQLAPPPFPLQFTPFNGQQLQQQQQQHMAFGNALALFTEILRKQQSEGEATGQEMAEENGTSQTHPSGELDLEEEDSDEQIDRMLDALVMERQGQAVQTVQQQQQPQGSGTLPAGERLCILPLPILVPIPMPLSIDFVLEHFSGTGIPGKSGVKRTA